MTENEAINILQLNRPFAYSELQNAVDMAIKALEKQSMVNEILHELKEYSLIGTVEELQALKEKNVAKKIIDNTPTESKEEFWYQCPNCKCDLTKIRGVHCWGCGQKLDWQ